ncbi:hypothetical protein, partial [Deinococcus sp. Arct2-2]|uniref:hypothetical protein n=1 Tax=Deinococcus sp. Arct2-2 TaxID=2568653 RepID=UPI001454D1B5
AGPDRSTTREQWEETAHQSRLSEYAYDPKARTDAELQADLLPALRTGETAEAAQARITAATSERQARRIDTGLGTEPWRPNLLENDATFPRAHTLDRHGAALPMSDMQDRVMGVGRWAGQPPASFAYKWVDDHLANRVIQQHIEQHWEEIRLALKEKELYKASWDEGELVGRGYYNKNVALPNTPRTPVIGETSWVQLTILLDTSGQSYILTAFPKGSFQ